MVGTGLKLKAQIDSTYLNMDIEKANAWQRNTEREFELWANDECDYCRQLNFGQLQRMAYVSALMSGDCGVAFPYKQYKGQIYGSKVMLIEADRIETPPEKMHEPLIRGGVEVNKDGVIVAYYISRSHPLDTRIGIPIYDRYPAFGPQTGRRNIALLAEFDRPGQHRGVPFLSPVIETLKQLSRYTDAEVMAAVSAGLVTVFITTPGGDTPMGENIPENEQVDRNDEGSYELGNGAIIGLNAGESIQGFNPTRPNTAFDGFVLAMCRQVGAALEIPTELLIKHFTASYSASRAALLEAWKFFKQQRSWLADDFCQIAYENWLYEAVAAGRIQAPGFMTDKAIRMAYSRASWYGPSPGQIDPNKEVDAAIKRIDNCLSTREREAQELTGADFEDIVVQRTQEEKLISEGGLKELEQPKKSKAVLADKDVSK